MPHLKVVRLTDRSRRPERMNETISLRRFSGRTKSGCFSKCSRRRSWYLDMRKKYEGSLTVETGVLWSGQSLPSSSCVSV